MILLRLFTAILNFFTAVIRALTALLPLLFRIISFLVRLMLEAAAAWGRGVIEAVKSLAETYADKATWIPVDYWRVVYNLCIGLVVVELVVGWVLLAHLTVWIMRVIF